LEKADYKVTSVSEKTSQRQPLPPFITSTMQREAAGQLGYAVKKTMQVAQGLYEGIELGAQGPVGLITYMRTDSTRISQQAQDEALAYVKERYGKNYVPDKPRVYTRKAKNVQDAHEAIRPTSVERTPESMKQYLSPDQFKLYRVIWERFLASQMAAAELLTKTVEITAGPGVFRASATETKFAGFTIVYNRPDEEETEETVASLPDLSEGEEVKLKGLDPKQHFTQPPPRFNEASLVKTLEELGIGRPSTYATTVATILDRKYVEKQGKMLVPTKLGKAVNELLVEHFSDIVDVSFTADMEAKLDQIEEDVVEWQGMLKDFYQPFGATLKKARENMDKVVILSEHKCPNCGQDMAIRSSRFGQFLGCIGYPECTTKIALTKDGNPVPPDRESAEICKVCASPMVVRYGRYGDYLACTKEECEGGDRPIVKSTGVACPAPDCGGDIIEKKSRRGKMFYGCSNYGSKKCTSAFWYPPLVAGGPKGDNTCPQCNAMLLYKTLKRGDQIACSSKECGFAQLATGQETRP
jgi:DNA topoisomerase I